MVISLANWYDSRLVAIFGLVIAPGAMIFPLSFALSDVTTDVYGFKNTRRAIRVALLFNVIFLAFGQMVIHLPSPADTMVDNAVFDKMFALNKWIVCGSFLSYLISEPLNSYLVAKLKIRWNGEYTGTRFLISTVFASLVDSAVFVIIAYSSAVSTKTLFSILFNIWILKTGVELLVLPFSVRLAKQLKKMEKIDIYDKKTNFNPFILDTTYDNDDNHFIH
jgi:uncharacterized integral membrane protein (TIGR00697 family)